VRWLCLVLLCGLGGCSPPEAAQAQPRPGAAAIAASASASASTLVLADTAVPAWLHDGQPTVLADEALALLTQASSHGLDPAHYQVSALQAALAAARRAPIAPEAALRFELALSAALQRYLQHLHAGRVDPRAVHHNFQAPQRQRFDADAALARARQAGRLGAAVDDALPPLPVYGALRQALVQYRSWGDDPAWQTPLPALPAPGRRGATPKLEPGQAWAGLSVLAQRLQRLGDLPPDALVPTVSGEVAVYGAPAGPADAAVQTPPDPLVQAVRRFQRRHGLAEDGVIGRATLAALNRSPAQRTRQIELTLERLRWTPLLQGPRMVVINVPEYVLRAYEVQEGRINVRLSMRVVVGKAQSARTPLFGELMRSIEFSPYWNVPRSIARDELVPRLKRDPGHFQSAGFEFVRAGGQVDTQLSTASLDEVLAGRARIRQRPGPHNALGDIKFVFPNAEAIFLHHTPAVDLFDRDRRDFSHGCIRVEEPVALAGFVLANQPEWDETRIRQAMGSGTSNTLKLAEPLPVLIAYGTALVTQGELRFFDDVYGYDGVLDAALRQQQLPALPAP
jgi:murein L,D-transpeptidase YcbB/YkuD